MEKEPKVPTKLSRTLELLASSRIYWSQEGLGAAVNLVYEEKNE